MSRLTLDMTNAARLVTRLRCRELALRLDAQRFSNFAVPITNANFRCDRLALTLRKLDRLRLQNEHPRGAENFFASPAVAMRLYLDDESRRHKRIASVT